MCDQKIIILKLYLAKRRNQENMKKFNWNRIFLTEMGLYNFNEMNIISKQINFKFEFPTQQMLERSIMTIENKIRWNPIPCS